MVLHRLSDVVEYSLPWPPSINNYWGNIPGRRKKRLLQGGRAFRFDTLEIVGDVEPLKGDLMAMMMAHAPNNIKRDVDNIQKAVWDALEHAGVYRNDSQLKLIVPFLLPPPKGTTREGWIDVYLRPLDLGFCQAAHELFLTGTTTAWG